MLSPRFFLMQSYKKSKVRAKILACLHIPENIKKPHSFKGMWCM